MTNSSTAATLYAALALTFGMGFGTSCGKSNKPGLADAEPADAGPDGADSAVDAAMGSGGSSGADAPAADKPACPASCDDQQPCTLDSCDTTTFQCVHAPLPDSTPCQGPPCTEKSVCNRGICFAGPFKTCVASDQCHVRGTCDQATSECTNPKAPDGTLCNDGDNCTAGDQCSGGVCVSIPLCLLPNRCEADAGSCTGPAGEPAFPSPLLGSVFLNLTKGNTNSLVSGPDGKVFLGASITGPSNLGSGPVPTDPTLPPVTSSVRDILVAQIDPAKAVATWVKAFFGQGDQKLTSLAVNGAGQIGLVGSFQGDFENNGESLLLAMTPSDQFIVGASAADGRWLWGKRLNLQGAAGTNQANGLSAVAADPASSMLIVCGTATRAATDLAPTLAWQGGQDAVVAALDGASGEVQWAMQIGGTNDDTCSAVAVDANSNVYVVGTYRWGSDLSFAGPDGGVAAHADEVDQLKASWTFVAKLSSRGEALWVKTLGSGAQQVGATAMVLVAGDLLIAGQVGESSSSGTTVAVDAGASAAAVRLAGFPVGTGLVTFLARLSGATGEVTWAQGMGQDMGVAVAALAQAQQGRIAVGGSYRSAGKLGQVVLPAPPSGKPAAFVAQVDAKTGIVAIAKGYGDPNSTSASNVVGVLARPGATDADKDTTLILTTFGGKLDFGAPVGVLDTGSGSTQALGLVKLAP
jgi:hypothetical protein